MKRNRSVKQRQAIFDDGNAPQLHEHCVQSVSVKAAFVGIDMEFLQDLHRKSEHRRNQAVADVDALLAAIRALR